MGLVRLVVMFIIAWLIYSLTCRWLASLDQPRDHKKPGRPAKIETMVCCADCGLHVPQNEALQAQGKYYCSDEHRKRAASS
ncbi:MAG TPA: hypothetical protein ENI68_06975 [Gammaproteobacteria bacterium]|nr:hypothetical protein [Gammaproteobacteria bacterium]